MNLYWEVSFHVLYVPSCLHYWNVNGYILDVFMLHFSKYQTRSHPQVKKQ